MKKTAKIWLIVSIALVVTGLAVFAGGMTLLGWDFTKLSNTRFETDQVDISQSFDNLSFNVETDDIAFALSDDSTCKIICYAQENVHHTAEVRNNTLEIRVNDTRKWYQHIQFFTFNSPKITVYLPKAQYTSLVIDSETGDIDIPKDFSFDTIDISASTSDVSCSASSGSLTGIKLSTGNIKLSNLSLGKLDLKTSTGDVYLDSVSAKEEITINVSTGDIFLNDTTCKSFLTDGSTGNINLRNTVASESFSLKRSTGDVYFDSSDAGRIVVKTSTGNVTGTLLSEKIFLTETSTGDVNVPPTTKGGKCEITTATGDISIGIIGTSVG